LAVTVRAPVCRNAIDREKAAVVENADVGENSAVDENKLDSVNGRVL
jgi:hypothetical protein